MTKSAVPVAQTATRPAPAAATRLQRRCACAATGESCARCDGTHKMQRFAAGGAPTSLPSSVHEILASPGIALDGSTRSFMEARFGEDFSSVRIHSDSAAAQSAAVVGAAAYTVGRHIAFAQGLYQPQRAEGRMLLAHELTHVVQQGAGAVELMRDSDSPGEIDHDESAEEEADLVAEAIAYGWPVKVSARSKRARLARQPFLGWAAGGCGICYRGNVRQIGIDAHNEIKLEFLRRYRGIMPEFPIVPKRVRGVIKKGIPDLIMATPTGFKIGEIKPANPEGYIEGEAKIVIYERLLKARYKKVNPKLTLERLDVAPPLPFPFPDMLSLTCQQILIVNPSVRGVYGYLCWPPFSSELRKRCRCVGDPPEKDDPVQKKTNKGIGISIQSSGGGMYNAGVGVSIYSTSSGIGNAGVGVTIASDSAAAGTVSAGGTALSGGQAIGAVAAGGAVDSSGTSAGTAGVGASKSTTSVAAGSAGAGTVSDSNVKGAGIAGAGKVEGSEVEGSGVAAKGAIKDESGTAASKKSEGDVETGDASGQPGKGKAEAGVSAEGTADAGAATPSTGASAKSGTGVATSGTGAGTGGAAKSTGTKAGDSTAGKTEKTGDAGAASGAPGAASGGGTRANDATRTELLTRKEMDLLGLTGKPVPRDAVMAAIAEAAKIRALIAQSSPAQQALLKAIAESAPDGSYRVPAAQWIEKMLAATQGISADDLAYLKTVNWKPSHVSADELRKRVLAVLAKKPKASPDPGKAAAAKDIGGGSKASKSGTGDAVGAKVAEVRKHRVFNGFTDRQREYWFVNFEKFDVAGTKKGDVKDMTIAFFGDDRGIYTYRTQFRVVDRVVEKTVESISGKPVQRVAVYFDLEGLNEDDWDVAPEGQAPFVLRKGAKARFRGHLR